jgi:glycerol-3-phosphate dehydrogenase (NAD(P)+)
MFSNVAIIGDGAMGSVCAILLCEKSIAARMWGYDKKQLSEIADWRENKKFLPGYKLPDSLVFEADDSRIFVGADLIVSAVPCQFMRGVWGRLKNYVPAGVPIVSVAKGIENKTLLRPSEILADVLGTDITCVVMSGPTIADELARKLPATALVASADEELAKKVQRTFNINWLRVYYSTDIAGVELAGAMKNVIAIAAGIVDGIGAGDNAKAALLSRGLAEISRLGIAMGAQEKTFAGLSGLGDLVTTCISPKGRNRSFGEKIGRGQGVQESQAAMRGVVEGVATCASVVELAKKYNIEMPITEAVYHVLFEGKSVQEAISNLMTRRLRAE